MNINEIPEMNELPETKKSKDLRRLQFLAAISGLAAAASAAPVWADTRGLSSHTPQPSNRFTKPPKLSKDLKKRKQKTSAKSKRNNSSK